VSRIDEDGQHIEQYCCSRLFVVRTGYETEEDGVIYGPVLPREKMRRIRQEYRRRYGLDTDPVAFDGSVIGAGPKAIRNLPLLKRARADALQESVRWGEPYSFFLTPGIMSWIIPMVNGDTVQGGLSGGEVRSHDDPQDCSEAITYLVASGAARSAAEAYVTGVPIWPQSRTAETATWLFSHLYEVTRWRPVLLERNRENALQQRQIAEEIHRRKTSDPGGYPLEQERALLSLIRVGDRGGARRALNQLLAHVFVYSVRLPLVQARMSELLGYLVRAAVEDNPVLGSLVERHIQWIERVIATKDFEGACAALREALDDFIDHIGLQGFNRHNTHVSRVLDFLSKNYTRKIRLEEAAALAGLSRFRVAHLVKECTGKTILQHIKRMRIQKARTWLEETNKDFAEIAYELGFSDQSHFIRHFRDVTGLTPARYRRDCGLSRTP
jgi:AraC-like DNA-binding protein